MAILVIILVAGMPTIERQLDAWGMLPRQEQLTQLYFTDPKALSKKYAAGEPLDLNFTVQNSQSHATRYTYTINESSQDARQSQKLTTGTFTLQAAELRHITVHITPSDLGRHVYLSVALTPGGQAAAEHIGYWAEQK